MKIREGFILRKVGSQFLVAAIGACSKDFNGIIRMNEEAAFAFGLLQAGISQEGLVAALVERFSGDPVQVSADVAGFVQRLKEEAILEP